MSDQHDTPEVIDFHEVEMERKKVMQGLLVGVGFSTALVAFIWVLHSVFGG